MKKLILFLASIVVAITFASEASALPVFARQTGMECAVCHFQHFPMLTAFGRAFKSSAFTMMGAQAKVEGDRLSIPATLNMAVLTTFGYEKTNAAPAAAPLKGPGNGVAFTPGHNGELSLFFGGRVNDHAGFLTELGMIGPVDQSSAKLPILFEVASDTHAGIVPFATNGQGSSYGFETLNTGASAIHQMSGVGGFNGAHSNALSAQQYIGTGAAATGFAFVVNSSSGFINLTKFNQIGTGDFGASSGGLNSTYLRVAGTFDVSGWDSGVGIQSWSGSSVNPAGTAAVLGVPGSQLGISPYTYTPPTADVPATYGIISTKATAIDGQMQGELAGKPVGFYASYAKAPGVSAADLAADPTAANAFNSGTLDRSSFNVSAEVGVLPGIATLGAAIRRAKSGVDEGILAGGPATGANATDNAIMLTATYKLSQNMMATLSYTANSGSYWTQANIDATGSKTTTINVFTLF